MNKQEIIKTLKDNNKALEYAAYNYNETRLEDVPISTKESACPAVSALIQVRKNKKIIKELNRL